MGLDTKTYWLTDRQSQYKFDFEFRSPERTKHGAKKTELKIRLPWRAVRNTELRR
jgi:hypothetical protein